VSRWRGLGHAWWVTVRAAARPPVTVAWPHEHELPFPATRGSVALVAARCDRGSGCLSAAACPTACLTAGVSGELALDHGACIGCGRCVGACPCRAVAWSSEPAPARTRRADLVEPGEASETRR
jgi:formate hydrogenlyase subunit 6/NADH:ubiquinone oxidoreductase subunit I